MVVVSYSGKEINAKLVYYGAGLCGKTTNLEAIYEAVPDTSRGKMVSMKTQSDRTLFFDLLPLDLGEIMGFKTRFLLYTVPGQVFYNATRKLVLKGADAIVFVVDSEVGKMAENRESLANLKANLAEYNISLDSIPWVLQYNKRDLPNVYSIEELNAELNPTGRIPFFESVAREGKGVFETFRGISHLLMEKVTKDLRRAPSGTSRPSEPVVEVAAKPTTAAPVAPVQNIQHEVHATPAPIEGGNDAKIDYGREIELPAPARGANVTPAPAPAPAPVVANVPEPVLQPVAAAAPEPVVAAAPAAVAPAPKPVAARPAPVQSDAPSLAPSPVVDVTVAAAPREAAPENRGNGAGQAIPLTVPVHLKKGGTYEIVIRLHIDADE